MMQRVNGGLVMLIALAAGAPANAQIDAHTIGPSDIPDAQLDPGRDLQPGQRESALHAPLPEQYIWTVGAAGNPQMDLQPGAPASDKDIDPQYFRRDFTVREVPAHATLYVAGPRQATVYLNGNEIGHYQLNLDSRIGIWVYQLDVTAMLHAGKNVLAIEAVRGPGAFTEAEDAVSRHLRHGKVLAVMIVPAERGIQASPVLMSDAQWKASARPQSPGWQSFAYDDSAWKPADDLGGIESSIDLFQGNADAGMYAWPGYDGISPFLAHYSLNAVTVSDVYGGAGTITNAQALVTGESNGEFTVTLPAQRAFEQAAPQILLDFGREVTGRIELQSDSSIPAEVTVQYGESEAEALLQPYLGVDPVYVPAHGTAYGPKSAFRYAIVRFTGGRSVHFRSIRLDGIAYPVEYRGSFESSDPKLNRLWTIGAYTAHLCMQDDIWDASKRDRNRWMGDLDVSGRTIADVFGDHFLIEDTLDRLIGQGPIEQAVNGIPGYSAFWVVGEKEYYLHFGSMRQLESVQTRLVQLLDYMRKDLDDGVFANLNGDWPFADWAPGLSGDTPQARVATQFEYYAAFRDGAYLLHILHDEENARRMEDTATAIKDAAQKHMRDELGTFGDRWQTNAYAVLSGVANAEQYPAIWRNVLSHAGDPKFDTYIVTPYYNYYVIDAMAKMGYRRAALDWSRRYWGGMVEEGATSFWEGYNLDWFKGFLFHGALQADERSGFTISLAHGWSSGITPWLMTQMLGIRPTAGGFAKVDIRPDLMGLEWAKGAEPTPHGLLQVAIRDDHGYTTTLQLPHGVVASVSLPVASRDADVIVNGRRTASVPAEGGKRAVIVLRRQGKYVVTTR